MAAVSEDENFGQEDYRLIINQWNLQYVTCSVWEEFSTHRTVDTIFDRDFISGLINIPTKCEPKWELQRYLLVLLCRLADGEEYEGHMGDTEEECQEPQSYLEHMAETLSKIAKDYPNIADEDVIFSARMQAVYVCCRDNAFDKAQEVFDRVWDSRRLSATEKRLKKKVQAVLESENCEHPIMEEFTYPLFVDNTMRCLQGLKDKLFPDGTTFLHQAAMKISEAGNSDPGLKAPDKHSILNGRTTPRKANRNNNRSTDESTESTDDETFHSPMSSSSQLKGKQKDAEKNDPKGKEKSKQGAKERSKEGARGRVIKNKATSDEEIMPSPLTTRSGKRRSQGHSSEHDDPAEKPPDSKKSRKAGLKFSKDKQAESPSKSQSSKRRHRKAIEYSEDDEQEEEPQASPSKSPEKRHAAKSKSPDKKPQYAANVGRRNRHDADDDVNEELQERARKDVFEYIGSSEDEETEGEIDENGLDELDKSLARRLNVDRPRTNLPRHSLDPRTPTRGGVHKKKKWTEAEEERLYQAVKELGKGNWCTIKEHYGFVGRSQVQLKDKWRTILKQGRHRVLMTKYGKIPGIDYF